MFKFTQILGLLLIVIGIGCDRASDVSQRSSDSDQNAAEVERSQEVRKPINPFCPRSGKPVAEDSLTEYRGYVVGFCNTHCRDDFADNVQQRPNDTRFFDAAISKLEADGPSAAGKK